MPGDDLAETNNSFRVGAGNKILIDESERSSPQQQRDLDPAVIDENNNQNVLNAEDQRSMHDLMKAYGVTGSRGQSNANSQQLQL